MPRVYSRNTMGWESSSRQTTSVTRTGPWVQSQHQDKPEECIQNEPNFVVKYAFEEDETLKF